MTTDNLRVQILTEARHDFGFDGFSETVLKSVASRLNIGDPALRAAFPRGAVDLALSFARQLDVELLAALEGIDLPSMKIRTRIATALKTRFDLMASERESVRRLVQFFARPDHLADGANSLYQTVDSIWVVIGDRSTDFNFYTKRAVLAAVVSSTTLFWLQDDSAGFVDTQAFIDRRIENVMQFEKTKAKLREWGQGLPDIWGALGRMRYGGSRRA
jgi:ubiquinone biosynthesis protein COQ9